MANEIVKETLHPDNNDNIDIYPKTSYDQVEGRPDLENGTGTGSLVQKRLKSDGVTWTTAKAYQGAGAAFGGNTQAGMTEEEFNAYFWDSVNNVPLHGGQGKNYLGEILDNVGLTYTKSYSFAFAANENNQAIARGSAAFGRYNKTVNPGEFVCGNYSEEDRNPENVFTVGGGANSEKRHNAFEVRTKHSGETDISRALIGGKQVATEEYVKNNTIHKEGTPYVVYINEAGGNSTIMPYRFNKQSIVDSEFTLMFQPMKDGRLYTRYPTDEYHTANKGYVDSKTTLYKHIISAANAIFNLIVINNSSAKITTFTSLLGANYISMYVRTPACTPAIEVGMVYEGADANIVGIKVGYYMDNINYIRYLDSNLESDTITKL